MLRYKNLFVIYVTPTGLLYGDIIFLQSFRSYGASGKSRGDEIIVENGNKAQRKPRRGGIVQRSL